MVGQVERVELRRRAKFGQNGQASAEMCRFLDFFNIVADAILYFFKFQIFNAQTAQEGRTASPCQICSKSV